MLIEEINNKNAIKYNKNTIITPKNFHSNFEKGISNAEEKILPNINIKYCIWHYKRALEFKKNELYYNEVKYNNNIYLL